MPFPKTLCDRVVTLYRPREDGIHRQETAAFYHYKDVWEQDRFRREFLLVLPEDIPLQPGDRIFDGIGPETVVWESFLPVAVPGLSQIRTAEAYCHKGSFHHWEATH